jgi:hypothetical protein|nr:MAG TPA: hypothetical protein [Ackermannviridae sp.]
MKNNLEIFREIKSIMQEKISKFNLDKDTILDGMYYLNGNDSTEFDILVNGNICELAYIYKSEYIAVKSYLCTNGVLWVYTFNDKKECIDNHKVKNFITYDEFVEFSSNIYEYTDFIDKYDEVIDESIFTMEYITRDFIEENKEYEEEYY